MPLTIKEIRQKYPQYDHLSDNDLADKLYNKFYSNKISKNEFNSKIGLSSNEMKPSSNNEELKKQILGDQRPFGMIQDLASGALKGGQNIAALLGEAGQALGSLASPLQKLVPESMKFAPDTNIREEMGLGKERPVDIGKLISPNANPLTQAIGQYAPGIMAGGASLPGQILSNSLYAGTQASPEQENLGGVLPEGRPGAMIEGAGAALVPKALSLAGKGLSKLNPMRFTNKNIIKDILETRKSVQNKYSELYDDLWKQANEKGLGGELVNKPEIKYNTIQKYTPAKKIEGLADFKANPTLDNAHSAKSELLAIQRELDKKVTHTKAEQKQYKAISKAIKNIQDNMFSTKEGKVDLDLLNQYKKVQEGYKNDVVPYRNKNINLYKAKEITDKQLIQRLSKGPFAAKLGDRHLIGTRDKVKAALKIGGLGGAGAGGISYLLKNYGNKGMSSYGE